VRDATPAAIFVALIGGGALIAIGASLGFWLWDHVVAHFAASEVDDTEHTDSGGHVNVSMRLRPFTHDVEDES
jgi:hypothetical protein